MCFTTTYNSRFSVVDKDIKCYKVLYKTTHGAYYTPYRACDVSEDTELKGNFSHLDVTEANMILTDTIAKKGAFGYLCGYIELTHEVVHAYEAPEDARMAFHYNDAFCNPCHRPSNTTVVITEWIIPAGTPYMKAAGEIVATKMKFNREIV